MLSANDITLSDLERDGFALFKNAVNKEQIDLLLANIEKIKIDKTSAGLRNLFSRCPAVKDFAYSGIVFNLASKILQSRPRAVRAILFDKTPTSNWYVTWHQDLTIPVKEKINLEGFGPWSIKDGIIHVQPPASILENMVSLRVHLDPCAKENGAIKFIPASHSNGVLSPAEIAAYRNKGKQIICATDRGDIIMMCPLILHSSSVATNPDRRRVLHIEYGSGDLPQGLQWAEA